MPHGHPSPPTSLRRLGWTLLAWGVATGLVGAQDSQPVPLVWRGCGVSKLAFMQACGRAYTEATGIPMQLSGGGATLGIDAAGSGGADLGGTCRDLLCCRGEDDLDVTLALVAWDALAVIVHPDCPVTDISRDQLRKVLSGEITNWKQLGGRNEAIIVVARRGKTSGVGHSTRQLIMEDAEADFGNRVIRLNSSGPVERLVEQEPRTIAITGISSARKRNVGILTIDGQEPTADNIAAGRYPYFRPLYVAYRPESNARASRFVAWILSEAGQRVIEGEGTVSLRQGALLGVRYAHFEDGSRIVNFADIREAGARAAEKQP